MIKYVLSFLWFYIIYAYEPLCSSCKYYIPHKTNSNLGLCKIFKENTLNGLSLKNYASHCRNDENLCGKSGFLYESMNIVVNNTTNNIDNIFRSQVNNNSEFEAYYKWKESFYKIKKHNTKRVYKTEKELYKLFKRQD